MVVFSSLCFVTLRYSYICIRHKYQTLCKLILRLAYTVLCRFQFVL